MAYLNVRERRIEAKIAYLGAPLAGKATNMERLGRSTSASGDMISTEWRPPSSSLSSAAFRDCDVTVKLVAPRGVLEGERARDLVRELVRDADGIVFVADAAPGSAERNRASLAAMRDAIEAGPRRDLPVVVQVNKTDLDDAVSADDVTATLELGAWPRIHASAMRGEGVVETAHRALAEILDLLQRGGDAPSEGRTSASPPAARVEGNPLLTALKQVLRDTVTEHVVNLEAQSGAAAMHRAAMEESARTRAAVEALLARVHGIERAIEQAEEQTARRLEQQEATLAALADLARSTPTAVERVGESLRADLVRAIEARAKTDRDHAAATATSLKRAVEAVAMELKATDPRVSLVDLRTAVQGAAEQTKAVAEQTKAVGDLVQSSTAGVRALGARVGEVEAAVQRDVRTALTRTVSMVEERIGPLRVDTNDGFEKTEARDAALHALLTELIEELKKPKKGWFG